MVSTHVTNKLKRARKGKDDLEFDAHDESETEFEDWDRTVEGAKEAAAMKGKSHATPASTKGKSPASTAAEIKARP